MPPCVAVGIGTVIAVETEEEDVVAMETELAVPMQ